MQLIKKKRSYLRQCDFKSFSSRFFTFLTIMCLAINLKWNNIFVLSNLLYFADNTNTNVSISQTICLKNDPNWHLISIRLVSYYSNINPASHVYVQCIITWGSVDKTTLDADFEGRCMRAYPHPTHQRKYKYMLCVFE